MAESVGCYRLTATAFAVTLYMAVAVLLPLLNDEHCDVLEWAERSDVQHSVSSRSWMLSSASTVDVPQVGKFFTPVIAATAMLVFFSTTRRYDREVQLHRWAWHYAKAVLAQGACMTLAPWVFVACPTEPVGAGTLYAVISVGQYLPYVASQFVLSRVAILRLELVGSHGAARRGTWIMFAGIFFGSLATIVACVWKVVPAIEPMAASLLAVAVVIYAAFQVNVLNAFLQVTIEARKEARVQEMNSETVMAMNRAIATVVFWSLSASTTFLTLMGFYLIITAPESGRISWFWEMVMPFDIFSDCGLVLLCAGLVGPVRDREAQLRKIRDLTHEHRRRQIQDKLKGVTRSDSLASVGSAESASIGMAATIAGLVGTRDPETLVAEAISRFRCISWDDLQAHPELILDNTPLDGAAVSTTLYALSSPCKLSECDAFLSHSWHDNADLKWAALTKWCERFMRKHGRAPKLWLDKVCINQAAIAADLECLPIFLAGCNSLLVLSGATYTSRLWCVMELFVYVSMRGEYHSQPTIIFLGSDSAAREEVRQTWKCFDAARCQCVNPADKQKILDTIMAGKHGLAGFNKNVSALHSRLSRGCSDVEGRPVSKSHSSLSSMSSLHSLPSITVDLPARWTAKTNFVQMPSREFREAQASSS